MRIACLKLSNDTFFGIHTTIGEYRSALSLIAVEIFFKIGYKMIKDKPVISTKRTMIHSHFFQKFSDNNRAPAVLNNITHPLFTCVNGNKTPVWRSCKC